MKNKKIKKVKQDIGTHATMWMLDSFENLIGKDLKEDKYFMKLFIALRDYVSYKWSEGIDGDIEDSYVITEVLSEFEDDEANKKEISESNSNDQDDGENIQILPVS